MSHRKVTYKGRTGGTDPLTHHTLPSLEGEPCKDGSGAPARGTNPPSATGIQALRAQQGEHVGSAKKTEEGQWP